MAAENEAASDVLANPMAKGIAENGKNIQQGKPHRRRPSLGELTVHVTARVCSSTSWLPSTLLILAPFGVYHSVGVPHTCAMLVAWGIRLGPMSLLLRILPEIKNQDDFEDRRYRVRQAIGCFCICSAVYTFIPADLKTGQEGWKLNLVTMETAMASTIASIYGYASAGGIPGGLLAEYVISYMGRMTVIECTGVLGLAPAKAITSFLIFAVMGLYMEFFAICAYAFAHQKPKTKPNSGRPKHDPVPSKEHAE